VTLKIYLDYGMTGVYVILFGWNISIIFERARVWQPDGRHRYPVNKAMVTVISLQAASITLVR
jgi:hypothetical protein